MDLFHRHHKEDQKEVFQNLVKFVYGTHPELLRGKDVDEHVKGITMKYHDKLAQFLWHLCDKIPLRGEEVQRLVRDCFEELNDYPRSIV